MGAIYLRVVQCQGFGGCVIAHGAVAQHVVGVLTCDRGAAYRKDYKFLLAAYR